MTERPTQAEIGVAVKWFDGLTWPDVRGKEYVEVTFRKSLFSMETLDQPKVRGILLQEDEKGITILSDGTFGYQSFL